MLLRNSLRGLALRTWIDFFGRDILSSPREKEFAMAMVVLRTPPLSSDQKKRIGDRVLGALHHEGIPAASTVILFQPEEADLYLDGGLFYEASRPAAAAPPSRPQPAPAPEEPKESPISFLPAASLQKARGRRSKSELADLREKLVHLLQSEGALSSFDAQTRLGLKESDGAPATLRRFFSELEEEGYITKQGQKRGTRYVWKGIVQSSAPALPPVKLVKRNESGDEDEG